MYFFLCDRERERDDDKLRYVAFDEYMLGIL